MEFSAGTFFFRRRKRRSGQRETEPHGTSVACRSSIGFGSKESFCKGNTAGRIGKFTVELGFVAGVENWRERRAGGNAERKEMAAENERFRGGIVHAESVGAGTEPCGGAPKVGIRVGSAAHGIGRADAEKTVDSADAASEAADSSVGSTAAPNGNWLHVAGNKGKNTVDEFAKIGHSLEKALRRSNAFAIVPVCVPSAVFLRKSGGRRLPEVVTENGETDNEIFKIVVYGGAFAGKGVEGCERVVPDVAFGMPGRILRNADESSKLGKVANPAAVAKETEPAGWFLAADDELGPFLEDALGGKPLGKNGFAELDSFGNNVEAEPRSKLHGAQNAERVFGKGSRGVPQKLLRKVPTPVKRVDDFVGKRVKINGIDREIAAGSSVFQ